MNIINNIVIMVFIQILLTFVYVIFMELINNIVDNHIDIEYISGIILLIIYLIVAPIYIVKKYIDTLERKNPMKH
tara:strand:+ start:1101 stop:1325 length:225 start_codon:yes stop_codon:yes gene_type:complete